MGSVAVESSNGGRRSLDSEINMIPMIDLLMVTVSFLLITAVWSHMARLEANAQVPASNIDLPVTPAEPSLHVRAFDDGRFILEWREKSEEPASAAASPKTAPRTRREVQADAEIVTVRGMRIVRYPLLAKALSDEWLAHGTHRTASDPKRDRVVLHTPTDMTYASMVGIMDALNEPEVTREGSTRIPAFQMTFASD
jgi:biopolymer transport protein ExbD